MTKLFAIIVQFNSFLLIMKQMLSGMIRLHLLTSGFLTGLCLYMFYVSYRIKTFILPPDPIGILPQLSSFYRPEIDLPLYLTGVVFVTLLGLALFFVFEKFLGNFPNPIQTLGSGFYFRGVFLLAIFLYIVAYSQRLFFWDNLTLVFAGTIVLLMAGIIISFLMPHRFSALLSAGAAYVDLFVFVVLGAIVVRLLASIFIFSEYAKGPFYEYLRNNDYWAFPGFTAINFLIIFFSLLVLIWFWLHPPKILVSNKNSILAAVVDYGVLAAIFYGVSAIVFIRQDDSIQLARYNFGGIVGPVSEILAGKSLLVDIPSQYGVVMMYVLAGIINFFPRMYTSFFWIIFSFMTAGFILLYFSMKRWFGWFAVFSLLLLFEHYYFATSNNILFNTQQSFVRFGWWILVFFFLCYKDVLPLSNRLKKSIELTLVGVGFYWAFDVGTYGLLAYTGYRVYLIFLEEILLKRRLQRILGAAVEIGSTLLIGAGLLSLFTFARSGEFPHWLFFLQYAKYFTSGFHIYPMKLLGPYIFVLSLYAFVAVILLHKVFEKSIELLLPAQKDYSLAAYICSLGLAQFIYFTGHSHTNGNLHTIVIPAILLFSWLLSKIPLFMKQFRFHLHTVRYRLLLGGAITLAFISFAILMTVGTMNMLIILKNRVDLGYPWLDDYYEESIFVSSVEGINRYLVASQPQHRRIAIVSLNTEYFLYKTKSANILEISYAGLLITVPQLEALAVQLAKLQPDVLFVDHSGSYITDYITGYVQNSYMPIENFGYLDRWVKKS